MAVMLSVGTMGLVPTELPKMHDAIIISSPIATTEVKEVTPTPTPKPTPKPTKSPTEKTVGYIPTKKEIDLLERLVYCEAGNQTLEAKVAVVNVVLNRVKSEEFPDTITEVVYQKRQFSPVGSGWIKTVTATEECKEAVQLALKGKKIVSSNTKYFFATWLDKSHAMWKQTKITKTIGKIAFGERNY